MICSCRLLHGHDSCSAQTSGPDEPICQFCIAAQHPQQDDFAPIVKPVPEWLEVITGART